MKLSTRLALLLVSLALPPVPASAITQPMTFEILYDNKILAKGQFTASTAATLKKFLAEHPLPPGSIVYLLSFGGELDEGMAVGAIIREHGFNTDIGSRDELPPFAKLFPEGMLNALNKLQANEPSATPALDALLSNLGEEAIPEISHLNRAFFPGYCLSACAYAYLGGVERTMVTGSRYGLHQFAGNCPTTDDCMNRVQEKFGNLIGYVQKMGVDPGLLVAASAAAPNSFNFLSSEEQVRYRVLYSPVVETWSLAQDDDGRTSLIGEFRDARKTQSVTFRCSAAQPGALVMTIDFSIGAAPASLQEIGAGLGEMAWATRSEYPPAFLNKWGDQGQKFAPSAAAEFTITGQRINWRAEMPAALVQALVETAETFTVATTVGNFQWPVAIAGKAPDRMMFQRFVRSCRRS